VALYSVTAVDDGKMAGRNWVVARRRGIVVALAQQSRTRPLPGDIAIEHGRFRFYFPLVTCPIISVVLSFFLWLLNC
jgi:hypothetical protein